jgi:hypothetical protein
MKDIVGETAKQPGRARRRCHSWIKDSGGEWNKTGKNCGKRSP